MFFHYYDTRKWYLGKEACGCKSFRYKTCLVASLVLLITMAIATLAAWWLLKGYRKYLIGETIILPIKKYYG